MGRLGRRGADAGRRLGTNRANDTRGEGDARDHESELSERRGRDVEARTPAAGEQRRRLNLYAKFETSSSVLASSVKAERGQPGVNLGSTWGQPGINVGSTWGDPWVNLGQIWGQPGANLGSTWDQPGGNLGST